LVLALLAGVALLGAGCSDDSTPTTTTTGAPVRDPAVTGTASSTVVTTVPATTTTWPPERRVVFQAGWGAEVGQFGFRPGQEATTEGPRAFWVGPGNELWILDPLNGRVQVAGEDGKVRKVVPIEAAFAREIAVTADGRTLLVEDVGDQDTPASFQAYDLAGDLLAQVPGPDPSTAAWLFAGSQGDAVYSLVTPDPARGDPGYVPVFAAGERYQAGDLPAYRRPTLPLGGGLEAGVSGETGGPARLVVRRDGADLFSVQPPGAAAGAAYLGLTEAGQVVLLASERARGDQAPPWHVWAYDQTGVLVRSFALPPPESRVDLYTLPYRLGPSGDAYMLSTSETGMAVVRFAVG